MDNLYAEYVNYIDTIFNINNFKSHPKYRYMLEHVSLKQGIEYYNLIKKESNLSDEQIIDFCNKNDTVGAPIKYNIYGITCSPTSLRYLYHGYRILHLLNDTSNIVEVGGGYGGLCLAVDYLRNIFKIRVDSYTIIDLPEANKVQREYLSKFSTSFGVNLLSAFDYKHSLDKDDYFLVSNYCISEIGEINRANYGMQLLPKVKRGFMVWNFIPFDYNMFNKFNISIETERPLTGDGNLYVILTEK